ncbi:long-chain fatty acid--CoA ligase [Siculibacillus lacustris]|uniref:Long-chain fatty acid--CoA ligase n=1 Tax=Siculibacillus lacustris TaxID=1549641 RepID=A0A4Q9VJI7_9HYPH|nr:long-chain fatty acid--CoA ligase [Siculibacillus lacustris]TBW35381.1 long-chain fatty acid--CoA ligase [Siculibacillus lacustris]
MTEHPTDGSGGGYPLPARSLTSLFEEAVAQWPERPCIDFLDRKWTYREIGDLVTRAAAGFRRLGVTRDTRVGLCLPNTPYAVICYFAVLKAGGTVVNFNPLYVEREIEHQIRDSGATVMVTMDLKLMLPKVQGLLGRTSLKTVVVCPMAAILPFSKALLFRLFKRGDLAPWTSDANHVSFARLTAEATPIETPAFDPTTEVAVLQYTGGTTGTPKGAMLTHANLTANAEQIRLWIPDGAIAAGQPRMLGVLPLFHVFAMTVVMNFGLRMGAELILLPRFELDQVLDTIERKKPTLFPGVPTIYTALNAAAAKGKRDLSSIEFCISGGAPLPLDVKTRFESLTGCRLVEGYGLSEASPVVTCNPVTGETKVGSIGLPVAGTTVEVRTPVTSTQLLGVGERGEICVRGPQVMLGYWRRPEDTADQLRDGLLRTGDIGYRDADGFVFLVDRIKDIIICGGYNVYPRVLEEALYQHEAVEEATVIAVSDRYRGQAPKAFVKLRDGAETTPEDLKVFLAGYVSKIELPREIEIRDSLPKTMVGKLSKKELIAEEIARDTAEAVGDRLHDDTSA